MGWLKKLKKRISMKNFVKGIKKVTKFIPGGDLISKGIGVAETAYKSLKTTTKKDAQGKPVKVASETQITTKEVSTGEKSNTTVLAAVAAGIAGLFFLNK